MTGSDSIQENGKFPSNIHRFLVLNDRNKRDTKYLEKSLFIELCLSFKKAPCDNVFMLVPARTTAVRSGLCNGNLNTLKNRNGIALQFAPNFFVSFTTRKVMNITRENFTILCQLSSVIYTHNTYSTYYKNSS
jgi:hypothetical protein